eukprot:4993835-Heterocapsa_arctica.AAC.1
MAHWTVHTVELHEQGYGGWMEAGPGWRAVPMGQPDCQLLSAGVQGQQGELSGDYEYMRRKCMNDDRSKFSLEERQWTTMWRCRNDYSILRYMPAQHQHQLEHFSNLGHLQVHSGQCFSRLTNFVNIEKHNRNRLRRERANGVIRKTQKDGRKHKVGKSFYRIGEASNPGPVKNNNNSCKQSKLG